MYSFPRDKIVARTPAASSTVSFLILFFFFYLPNARREVYLSPISSLSLMARGLTFLFLSARARRRSRSAEKSRLAADEELAIRDISNANITSREMMMMMNARRCLARLDIVSGLTE